MATHLAIFVGDAITKILHGEKTVDVRLSQVMSPPFRRVMSGDTILLKQSSGSIVGEAQADNVLYYDHLTPETVQDLKNRYGAAIAMPEQFWQNKATARYATVIFLKNPKHLVGIVPMQKNDRRGWVVL